MAGATALGAGAAFEGPAVGALAGAATAGGTFDGVGGGGGGGATAGATAPVLVGLAGVSAAGAA